MKGFREVYGSSPLHLLLVLSSFALTLYAGVRLLDGDTIGVLVWFVGAALLHDLVLLPLYTLTDRAAQAALGVRGHAAHGDRPSPASGRINYVRVPAFISGVLLLTWFPLILGQVGHYTAYTGLPDDVFLGRWLLITAVLFGLSALWLLVRMWSSRPPRPKPRPQPQPHKKPAP
ncbi:hypothetical protein ACFXKW_37635 [Streptomyces sp. NPDC059193]|uniref:hypothetical protein n=1 Tax=Streptomyces sp. NPDC059193 TaxID=3346763 RepID=UPI003687E5C2